MPEHDIRIRDCEDEAWRIFRAQAIRAGKKQAEWFKHIVMAQEPRQEETKQ